MIADQLWKLFEKTGAINYYLFYRALQIQTESDTADQKHEDGPVPLADAN